MLKVLATMDHDSSHMFHNRTSVWIGWPSAFPADTLHNPSFWPQAILETFGLSKNTQFSWSWVMLFMMIPSWCSPKESLGLWCIWFRNAFHMNFHSPLSTFIHWYWVGELPKIMCLFFDVSEFGYSQVVVHVVKEYEVNSNALNFFLVGACF